jgi:superfamily II DNA or RNA helicase/HKD family nuclease
MGELAEGVYESLHTAGLSRELADAELTPRFEVVDPADAPEVLARHVADAVRRTLLGVREESARVALVNELVSLLGDEDADVIERLEQLIALTRQVSPWGRDIARPVTPLSDAALLTNAPEEPTLGAELRSELASADRVDLLCAFIRWHGLRVIEQPLLALRDRGVPFRVITTTYMGATERRALDELVRRFGAEVRISYETQSTRLHAKAWLFRRHSGFDTAFVGSSNLSKSALVDGLEWNVRLSGVATPQLIRKFEATFDTYWSDPAFTAYDPDTDSEQLDVALARAGGGPALGTRTISLAGLEVRPFPHQEQILEALEAEREIHARHRNLVVAATGTGKTVVAALDYRRLVEDPSRRPSLLFVAHRKEILDQSLRTYREVLADGAFGETYVAGARPERWRHVFASIQSLSSYGVDRLPPDHFDVVVVDEFHHAEAATYRRLLEHLRPRELLGLTATPERADGVDVRSFFDGRTAFEQRLWDALADDLLVPFHYFGVADDVDLRGIEWKRGAYDVVGLDRLYTGNDARAAKVLRELRDKVTDVHQMRALGFCVSVAHAEYMARVFREAGIPALAVSGQTPGDEREAALMALRSRELNVLFAADLFNEGVDLPEVDTVLFLRPTQSATVFLQQLGRGLRRAPGKAVLTALDFIGQHRREYRFDVRYRALTGVGRAALERQVEQGFPFLPSGSQLVLDRVAQQIVLDSVRQQLRLTRKGLAMEVRSYGDLPLAGFLAESGRDLVDIYRGTSSWTDLRRLAGLPTAPAGPDEAPLLRRLSSLLHVDDPERAETYALLMAADAPHYDDLTPRQQRLARMLFFTLWPNKGDFASYQAGLDHLRRHPAACAEAREVLAYGLDRARLSPRPLGESLQAIPVFSHARYRREEILAALDWATWDRVARGHFTGVAWAETTQTDALLVNLRKSEAEFSPTTMYRDYAISPELFHWESQNTTRVASPTGQRYLHHAERGSHIVLFVRETPTDDLGAAPFLCLGPATYVEHRGERPIAITWRLHRRMPGEVFHVASVVAR